MSENSDSTMPQESPSAASILGWRYEYRFLAPDRVDIDVHLTFHKADDTPIVVGASLFAAGNTTPSGVVDSPAGVYDVLLPIRNFHCIQWTPYTVPGGAQKRYLLNMKLTGVPEGHYEEPEVIAFLGGTVGFRAKDSTGRFPAEPWNPQPEDEEESTLRARLMQKREAGIDQIVVATVQSETLYRLCDELGILIVQEHADGAAIEAERAPLRNHPCVSFRSTDTAI